MAARDFPQPPEALFHGSNAHLGFAAGLDLDPFGGRDSFRGTSFDSAVIKTFTCARWI
jgi:hypothetical protein